MTAKKYRGVCFEQTPQSKKVVLFAAPATDVWEWSGIPQRELLDDLDERETIGFQRQENDKRIEQLREFYGDPRNIVQNPLLCARRDSRATFEADEGQVGAVRSGWVIIEDEDLASVPLLDLFRRVGEQLRARSGQLANVKPDPDRLAALQTRLGGDVTFFSSQVEDNQEDSDDPTQGLFANETHILEFYQEIICRQAMLDALDGQSRETHKDQFLGFTREVLESYLKPVFLVDGQHRLRGAVLAANSAAEDDSKNAEILAKIESGEDEEALFSELAHKHSRILPVSLLMEESVEEHVFQFVVVNQKATPMGNALLGTIVSTSLSEEELNEVTDRLNAVKIDVANSQAVAWFTRNPASPFRGMVQQGMSKEGGDKLPWTVLRDLTAQFRNLRGAKLPHSQRIDYADKWGRERLPESRLVEQFDDLSAKRSAWAALDGPWRDVCATFFTEVRDCLADTSNPYAPNAWGSTRENLYNKVTLSILVADFFQFLTDKEFTIHSVQHCRELTARWLDRVDKNYFARNWNLSGVKKDTAGIKAQWSELWVDYRKDPQRIPDVRLFRKARQV
ncbi:hypothetical protein ACFV2W_08985 [Streptomyces cellulosae]